MRFPDNRVLRSSLLLLLLADAVLDCWPAVLDDAHDGEES